MTDGILTTRDDLNSFAGKCYGIMSMQLDFVCNDKVFNHVGQVLPFRLILTIHQRQLRFLGHILRKPDKKPINKFPPHTSHFIRTRWSDTRRPCLSIIYRVLNKEFLPSPKTIRRAIQHRGQWHRPVADGSFAVGWEVVDRFEAQRPTKVRERNRKLTCVFEGDFISESRVYASLPSSERNIIALDPLRPVAKNA